MRVKSRILTAAVTLSIAIAAGYYMQNQDQLAARISPVTSPAPLNSAGLGVVPQNVSVSALPSSPVEAQAASRLPAKPRGSGLPMAPAIPEVDVVRVGAPERLLYLERYYRAPDLGATEGYGKYGIPCDLSFAATPMPGAIAKLELDAPCHPHARIVISHEGLRFSAHTSNIGRLTVDVPVLVEEARFSVVFGDGEGATASARVPDVADHQRVVLQWRGETGLNIHALENGADYGAAQHIWARNPGAPDRAVAGQGGFLVALGDAETRDPLFAEVYTYPAAIRPGNVVRVNVEAEILPNTCGREVLGQTLQTAPDGDIAAVDLAITMPACDAVGDYLVLKNLLQDLKIAQN